MQLNLGFFALAGMVASLVGATALPNAAIEERADEAAQFDGHLFVCIDENWSGACLNIGFYAQQCQNFPSGFDNQITSVGPDQGWQCHLLMFVKYYRMILGVRTLTAFFF
ncbi:hypothetical protein EIP86_009609 [Pleurotus ostreatoroseus]|nr:hypothetical protein EIP86_009609 [Pleurotus ostreatoroseus]